MAVLSHAVLAIVIFAVLYLISRVQAFWVARRIRARSSHASHAMAEPPCSRVRPAKFGTKFR